jgi:hypothetical protein
MGDDRGVDPKSPAAATIAHRKRNPVPALLGLRQPQSAAAAPMVVAIPSEGSVERAK